MTYFDDGHDDPAMTYHECVRCGEVAKVPARLVQSIPASMAGPAEECWEVKCLECGMTDHTGGLDEDGEGIMTTAELREECQKLRRMLRSLVYQVVLQVVRRETLDEVEAIFATKPQAYGPVPGPPINPTLELPGRSRQPDAADVNGRCTHQVGRVGQSLDVTA